MRLALHNGELSTAEPRLAGHCPQCDSEVIAKCGPVNAWHWAHKATDCDTWSEPLTQWHADWQSRFPIKWCEIPVGDHRADVRLPGGLVLEFQHSHLSADQIQKREQHYGRMVWIFDATDAYDSGRLDLRTKKDSSSPDYRSFRWKHPRRSLLACQRTVMLDLGEGKLLNLKRLYPKAPYGGWGYLTTVEDFLARYSAGRAAA
jgi:competence protein CoiA